MSKNVTISYLREFCAQMSQNVLLADLSDLRLITTVRPKMYKNSFVPEICAQMSQMVFLADFTVFGLLQLYKQKWHKTHISTSFVHKCDKSCF